MPVVLRKQTRLDESEHQEELALFNEDGELTLAGEVVADFLEHADFSNAFDHTEAANYLFVVEDEDDAEVEEEMLPGVVARQLIDEDDLAEMFLHYLDILGERASAEDAPLEDRARLAVFESLLLDERFRRGAFRKARSAEGGATGMNSTVNRMLGAMLQKGVLKRAKKPGAGYKGGDYTKGPRYRTGGTKATKRKAKAIARRKKAKVSRAKKGTASRKAGRKLRALAASIGMEEGFVFGEGVPYGGALFAVDVNPDAVVEFTDEAYADLCSAFDVFTLEERKKGAFGKKKSKSYDDEEGDEDEGADDADEGKTEPNVAEAGTFASAVGRPALSEGASIARSVMQRMGNLPSPNLNG